MSSAAANQRQTASGGAQSQTSNQEGRAVQVIDVEQSAIMRMASYEFGSSRRTPQVPRGRPVHWPNDYRPADWEKRHQEAADRLAARAQVAPREVTPVGANRTPQFEASMIQCLLAIKGGADLLTDIMPHVACGLERVRDFTTEAHRRGLAAKVLTSRGGKMFNVWSVTDAGEALLSEAGQ